MEYEVHTRKTVADVVPDRPHAFISICDSDQEPAVLPDYPGCLGVLRLSFDDAVQDSVAYRPLVLFDDAFATEILDFVRTVDSAGCQRLYIHCNGGQCRSPAVAAALTKLDGGDDNFWFHRKRPNMLVYRTLVEVGITGRSAT